MTTVVEARPHSDVETPDQIRSAFLAGHKPRTAATYKYDLRDLATWLTQNRVHAWDCKRSHITLWKADLEARNLAPATIGRRLSTASGFFDLAVDSDCLAKNPVERVRRPQRVTLNPRDAIKAHELAALLKEGRKHSPQADAIISLCGLNGFRISEVLGIRPCDLAEDLTTGEPVPTVTVTRKGGDRDTQPLCDRVMAAVLHLVDVMDVADEEPLFRWDRNMANRVVKRCGLRVGIAEDDLSPHVLRHTAITLMADSGAALHEIQKAAGWKSPAMFSRYAHAKGLKSSPTFTIAQQLVA